MFNPGNPGRRNGIYEQANPENCTQAGDPGRPIYNSRTGSE